MLPGKRSRTPASGGYNGTVVGLRKPNPDLFIMRVKPDFPRPPHRAGQYCSAWSWQLGTASAGLPRRESQVK